MGLKSGSRDAEFDDETDDGGQSDDRRSDVSRDREEGGTTSRDDASNAEPEPETSASRRPTMASLPYKLRRDKVNEGREQVPYFLREEIIEAEADLQDTLEELLGESVYKSDYREAAMVVAQRNPELIAEVLREWGYDLDSS
jgi:flagellar biosynthesis/type III secretory pathway M-ring protein FliF/YscJ